jgi:hypothetical protein
LKRVLLQVLVDGKVAFNGCVFWESMPARDFLSDDPTKAHAVWRNRRSGP